jgi:hypothetical protein
MIRIYCTLAALAAYLADSYALLKDDDEGAVSTEIAVVTFLLVGAAIVVMGIIYAAAQSNANNIPVPQAPAG